jgi:two-component system chemotaxis response regulator CheY
VAPVGARRLFPEERSRTQDTPAITLFHHFGLEFSKMQVLYVEDNEFALNLGKTALQKMGFKTVIVAKDGQEAIDTIEHFPDIKLIISDWNMPKVSGIDLLHIARERWPGVPFVMVTSNDSVEHVAEARRSGVFAYVLKPFTLHGLRKKNHLRHSQAAGRLRRQRR